MVRLENNELLEQIPSLFHINLKEDKEGVNIFEKLGQIFEFDFASIVNTIIDDKNYARYVLSLVADNGNIFSNFINYSVNS